MNEKYEVYLEEDPATGDLILPLPEVLLKDPKWANADNVKWEQLPDGAWSITPVEETDKEFEYVMVDTLSTFRIRYAIKVPKGTGKDFKPNSEYPEEFSQEHLGMTVVSKQVLNEDALIELFDADNSYLVNWTREQKLHNIVNEPNGDENA